LLLAASRYPEIRGHSWDNNLFDWIYIFEFIVFAAICLRWALPSSVRIDSHAVTLSRAFWSRSLRFEEIKGRRTKQNWPFGSIRLVPRSPAEPDLVIPDHYQFDAAWNRWLSGLTDLDEQDRSTRLLQTIEAPNLGEDAAARLRKATRIEEINLVLMAITILAGVAAASSQLFEGLFDETLMSQAALRILILFLAACPWLAIGLVHRWPLLFSLVAQPGDSRATLLALWVVPSLALLDFWPVANLKVEEPIFLLSMGFLLGSLLALTMFRASPALPRPKIRLAALILVSWLYGYGLCRKVDIVFDHTSPISNSTPVAVDASRHEPRYEQYLWLKPWNSQVSETEVNVSRSLFEGVQAGESVCVAEHRGALYAAWYTVSQCK
jgi:hypothetical protein